MNKERLILMRNMLEEVKANQWQPTGPLADLIGDDPVYFDLNTWGEYEEPAFPDDNPCGFQACAIGHALLDHRFQDLGLHDSEQETYVEEDDDLTIDDIEFSPEYEGMTNFTGIAVFFDISTDIAAELFHPDKYPDNYNTDTVINRIDDLIANGDPS